MGFLLFTFLFACNFAAGDAPEQGSVLVVYPLHAESQNKIPTHEAARYLSSVTRTTAKGVFEYELGRCRAQQKESCDIPFSNFGTAFLAGNSRTLWTAAHAFARAVKGGVVRDGELAFLLLDKKAKVVFDSRVDGPARGQTIVSYDDKVLHDTASDFVRLTLPKDLPGIPLRFAAETPKAGDIVKMFSDEGRVTRVSQVLGDADLEKLGIAPAARDGFFFVGYPAREGMSGGPVVDPRGQILGLYLAHSAQDPFSRVIAAKQLQALERLKPLPKY